MVRAISAAPQNGSNGALLGLSGAMPGYGLALYCTRNDFNHATRGPSSAGEYDQLRSEFGPLERYDQAGGASDSWEPRSDQTGQGGGISDAADGWGIGGHGSNDGGGSSEGDSGNSGGDSGGGDGGGDK